MNKVHGGSHDIVFLPHPKLGILLSSTKSINICVTLDTVYVTQPCTDYADTSSSEGNCVFDQETSLRNHQFSFGSLLEYILQHALAACQNKTKKNPVILLSKPVALYVAHPLRLIISGACTLLLYSVTPAVAH